MISIRPLKADEIDVRVGGVTEKHGGFLLLYKDARCDMKILDEVFGPFNWQRKHENIEGQLFCTVSVYDEQKKMWISKQDVGVESYSDEVKGRASDAFKRACFNFGIGRELYTAPFIWIPDKGATRESWRRKKFRVKEIAYDSDKNITDLVVEEQINYQWEEVFSSRGYIKYPTQQENAKKQANTYVKTQEVMATTEEIEAMFDFAKEKNVNVNDIRRYMQTLMNKTKTTQLTSKEVLELNEFIVAQSNLAEAN